MMSCIRPTVEESGTRAESQVGKRDLSPLFGRAKSTRRDRCSRDPLFDPKSRQQRQNHRLEGINKRKESGDKSLFPTCDSALLRGASNLVMRDASRITHIHHASRIPFPPPPFSNCYNDDWRSGRMSLSPSGLYKRYEEEHLSGDFRDRGVPR